MDDKNYFCLLIRGKPCAGKTTFANNLEQHLNNVVLLDPDNINVNENTYKKFRPRMTKNPSDNVKMYSYLFDQAEINLQNSINVVWAQPWSRQAEIDLTVRNFGYYFSELKDCVWKETVDNVWKTLPFKLVVIEIELENNKILRRWQQRNKYYTKADKDRLLKTIKYYQSIKFPFPHLKLSGSENPEKNSLTTIDFLINGLG